MLSILSRFRSRYPRSLNRSLRSSIVNVRHGADQMRFGRKKSIDKHPGIAIRFFRVNCAEYHDNERTKYLLSAVKKDVAARRDPHIWNELYAESKHLNGKRGIDRIWATFAEFPLEEVPILYNLDVWNDISGHELVTYIHKLDEIGVKPPTGTLRKIGLRYHKLSILQLSDAERLEAALEHTDVEVPGNIYNELIPRLCEKGDVDRALAWHRRLVAEEDPPRDLSEVKPLRQMLIDRRQWAAALEVKNDVKPFTPMSSDSGGISSSHGHTLEKRRLALQTFVRQIDTRLGISQQLTSLDDYTCARLFATKIFSVDFVIDGLALFEVAQLGSLSTRELVKRSIRGQMCDSELVRHHFRKLNGLGITCETKYGRILEHLAESGKDALLHSIATSEDSPELFEDLAHQEKLLKHSNRLVIERTREVLLFETEDGGIEARNTMLRAGCEDIESMIADGVPITQESRRAMLTSIYVGRAPWISESKLRLVARIFSRLRHVSTLEWRRLIRIFLYVIRPHLRVDLEALLLSSRNSEVFDFRTNAGVIRWYLRVGAMTEAPQVDTLLGGVKVLAALRDHGLVCDIERACEVNLISLFGNTSLSETIDRKKRKKAKEIGTFEDFVIAIRGIYDKKMWRGMTPSEVKTRALATAHRRRLRKLSSHEASTQQLPPSHTGAYNFGKVWHNRNNSTQDKILEKAETVDMEFERLVF